MNSSKTLFKGALFASATALGAVLATSAAYATDGYFSNGYGTSSKGIVGSGTAMGQDSLAAATNPASMRDVGTRADLGVALFSPKRQVSEVTAVAASRLATGATAKSGKNLFLIPNFGYNRDLDSTSSVGLSVYGNGGMNTSYDEAIFNASNIGTGMDLAQLFVGVTYARDFSEDLSIGITPKLAVQRFKATGLGDYDNATHSNYVGYVTDNGYDMSYGAGMSIGATYKVNDMVSLGGAYHSRTFMTKFDKYKGLFAEQGDFDIPSSLNLGVAVKANDKLTVTADFQRINYGEVKAVSNEIVRNANLGADDGTGFGWQDMNVFKLGATYQYNPELTLRAGISRNNQNPYPSGQYLFNIIAPAVVRTHVSFGGTYKAQPNSAFMFAVTHALEASPNGAAATAYGGGTLEHKMYQWDVEVGYTWNF